jgi:ketosteroid isomerase-like protein
LAPTPEPVEVVRQHYAAIRDRDRAALLGTLDDNVQWEFLGPPEIPFAGRWQGIDAASRFFSIIRDTVDVLEFAVDDMIAQGETVAVVGRERFRVKATGREWACGWVQVHTVADGKIRTFREFSDTAAISAAYHGT